MTNINQLVMEALSQKEYYTLNDYKKVPWKLIDFVIKIEKFDDINNIKNAGNDYMNSIPRELITYFKKLNMIPIQDLEEKDYAFYSPKTDQVLMFLHDQEGVVEYSVDEYIALMKKNINKSIRRRIIMAAGIIGLGVLAKVLFKD